MAHQLYWMEPKEELPPGHEEGWSVWKSLNRLRTEVTRSRANLQKWGYLADGASVSCECGEVQTCDHFRLCLAGPVQCSIIDLMEATDAGLDVARHWAKVI